MLDPRDLFGEENSIPAVPTNSASLSPTQMRSVVNEAPKPVVQFKTAEEELAFLRAEFAKREQEIISQKGMEAVSVAPERKIEIKQEAANQVVGEYKKASPEILHPAHQMHPVESKEISLNLKPEDHDSQVSELYGIMLSRGVKNAFSIIEQTKNLHLEDDFHRFLVQYLVSYGENQAFIDNKSELFSQLDCTLYEVTLPRPDKETEQKNFKEFVAVMEQFYAGMLSVFELVKKKKPWYSFSESLGQGFSIEIAKSQGSSQVIFYVSVPNIGRDMFEKHVLGVYPTARLTPLADDYNVVNPNGIVAGSYCSYQEDEILPIRTFEQFEVDTLDVMLNVFTKLHRENEGVAMQIVLHPASDSILKEYREVLGKLQQGEKLKDIRKNITLFSVAKDIFTTPKEKEANEKVSDNQAIERLTAKIGSLLVKSTIRVIASAEKVERAEAIVREIGSAFNQFNDPLGNRIEAKPVKPNDMFAFGHEFVYRLPSISKSQVMNLKELATICHFPATSSDAAELKQAQAATAPAPLDLPRDGILLGTNNHRGVTTPIHYGREDRVRHFYIIGQTGTGKTGFLTNMIIQDIKNGDGVCFIDPHGSDVQTILASIPPERIDDVIYFDPAYTPRPMGMNMLEYDPARPEQISLIIDEMMNIFNQLFDMAAQGGAMFQQYFKNSAFLVMGHPESGNTLMEISRVLSDKSFRDMKLRYCKSPLVAQFWKNAEATTGDQGLQNFVPYITSKFDPLISNEFLRPIVTQERSAFNMREIMDNKKILLINLSKGLLGELNANLLGLILVGKIQMATMSRADSHGVKFPDFYLYIDEFQNFTTPAISSILSEARKYRLSLNVAHQFMAQLDEKIKNAVLGNVGSMAVCRISDGDAEQLAPYFAPQFKKEDITKLENMNCYLRLLAGGTPKEAFNLKNNLLPMDLIKPGPETLERIKRIKELSYMKYGRPREEVEEETMVKFRAGGM